MRPVFRGRILVVVFYYSARPFWMFLVYYRKTRRSRSQTFFLFFGLFTTPQICTTLKHTHSQENEANLNLHICRQGDAVQPARDAVPGP